MEKNRLFVFRGTEPEEPLYNYGCKYNRQCQVLKVTCCVDLCEFKDLQIKLVKINEILSDPENPDSESLVLVESKTLRDCRGTLFSNHILLNIYLHLQRFFRKMDLKKVASTLSQTPIPDYGNFLLILPWRN